MINSLIFKSCSYILEEERKLSAYNAGSRGRGHEISGPPQLPTRNLPDGQVINIIM